MSVIRTIQGELHWTNGFQEPGGSIGNDPGVVVLEARPGLCLTLERGSKLRLGRVGHR